ncbi:NAD binding domain of 6-phosphogluconate dehydrogenase [Popillia japonica]|uniref:NAD binding domain of 6-phosphogluconate dehydrogenase n=1 Tax=Popillia japonica TaxID=7064 RepID=A0AAW1N1V7_POPJA
MLKIIEAEDIKTQAEVNHAGYVETYSAPCDVVENSDIIFCCVSDVVAVKDIVYGNCGLMHNRETLDGKGYVEMTSIDSETSLDICNFITKSGGRYLEAQLQGSKQEAHDANLIVLGAGDEGLFNQCLAEAFALADRSGIAPKDVLEVFSLTAISNPFLKRKAELIVSTDFQNVEQPLMHMQKDTKLALQLADSLRQPLLMTAAANEIYKHTRRFGCDSHDAASVYMRARH